MRITILCPENEEILIFSQTIKSRIRTEMGNVLEESISVFFRKGDNNATIKVVILGGAKMYPPTERPTVRRNIANIFYGEKVGYPKQKIKVGVNFN
jgi:hypothetical protein